MKSMNRISRRVMNQAAMVAGAALIALASAASPILAQSAAVVVPPPPVASARTVNHLIADGVGADGKVKLTVNKTIVLTTTQPYKQVSVGQPDIADVNMISPNNILVTAKKSG